MTQVTIQVPSLDATIQKVTANGGRILESKMAIPGIGWYATCAEPGGLKFGILQVDLEAK
jgi:predicted enzyme related to lactoylglutathione lyase